MLFSLGKSPITRQIIENNQQLFLSSLELMAPTLVLVHSVVAMEWSGNPPHPALPWQDQDDNPDHPDQSLWLWGLRCLPLPLYSVSLTCTLHSPGSRSGTQIGSDLTFQAVTEIQNLMEVFIRGEAKSKIICPKSSVLSQFGHRQWKTQHLAGELFGVCQLGDLHWYMLFIGPIQGCVSRPWSDEEMRKYLCHLFLDWE